MLVSDLRNVIPQQTWKLDPSKIQVSVPSAIVPAMTQKRGTKIQTYKQQPINVKPSVPPHLVKPAQKGRVRETKKDDYTAVVFE